MFVNIHTESKFFPRCCHNEVLEASIRACPAASLFRTESCLESLDNPARTILFHYCDVKYSSLQIGCKLGESKFYVTSVEWLMFGPSSLLSVTFIHSFIDCSPNCLIFTVKPGFVVLDSL